MKTKTAHEREASEAPPAPARVARYEPPRILAKRRVERVTLVSGDTGPSGPGGGIGGE